MLALAPDLSQSIGIDMFLAPQEFAPLSHALPAEADAADMAEARADALVALARAEAAETEPEEPWDPEADAADRAEIPEAFDSGTWLLYTPDAAHEGGRVERRRRRRTPRAA